MAYFKISEPNKAVKYIKDIDRANGTLTFSETKEGCFQQDSGFFANSELEYLKFHFTEDYPELQYLTVDDGWNDYRVGEALHAEAVADAAVINNVVQELPNEPNPIGEIVAEEFADANVQQIADNEVLHEADIMGHAEADVGVWEETTAETPW